MRFDEYMEDALYGPHGFYTQGGQPGLYHGDFVTSPERGQLFGRCLANYLDAVWHDLGEPERFLVIEAAAGTGALCQAVLAAQPKCLGSLNYLLVERSAAHRRTALDRLADISQASGVPVAAVADLPASVSPPVAVAQSGVAQPSVSPPVAAAQPSVLPPAAAAQPSVIVANELLDNMAVRIVERTAESTGDRSGATDWQELYTTPGLNIQTTLQPASPEVCHMANKLVPDAAVGTRIPLQVQANLWVRRALRLLGAERVRDPRAASALPRTSSAPPCAADTRVLIFDYGTATTAELAQRSMSGWLRTYANHRRSPTPANPRPANPTSANPNSFDITCDIGFDQLPPGYTLTTQATWLATNGIEQFTEPARQRWQSQLANPTSAALAERALLDEAADLTNPAGLGNFCVAEWRVATPCPLA